MISNREKNLIHSFLLKNKSNLFYFANYKNLNKNNGIYKEIFILGICYKYENYKKKTEEFQKEKKDPHKSIMYLGIEKFIYKYQEDGVSRKIDHPLKASVSRFCLLEWLLAANRK